MKSNPSIKELVQKWAEVNGVSGTPVFPVANARDMNPQPDQSKKKGDKVRKQMASAYCDSCGEEMKSELPGHYVGCSCGKSFVDTSRSDSNFHRYGGQAVPDERGNFWVYTKGINGAKMEPYDEA